MTWIMWVGVVWVALCFIVGLLINWSGAEVKGSQHHYYRLGRAMRIRNWWKDSYR